MPIKDEVPVRQVASSVAVGGATKIAIALCAEVKGSRLLAPEGASAPPDCETEHFRLDALTSNWTVPTLMENLRLARRYRNSSSIFHVHSPWIYGASRFLHLPVKHRSILHIHLDFNAAELMWPLKHPPDAIVLCAEYLRPSVEAALNVDRPLPVKTIMNCVDADYFASGSRNDTRKALGVDADKYVILLIANLAKHKGQETALKALQRVSQEGEAAELWLAGEDRSGSGYQRTLMSLARELGVCEQVRFLGYRTDIPDLLAASDVVVLPSTSEGLPLSLLEAQAACRPVIAAPTAGIPEIVEDAMTGFLVDADDSRGYADTILKLIRHPEITRSVTASALEQVRLRHTWQRYVREVASLYEALLS